MTETKFLSYRLYFTITVTIIIWILLIWSHFHDGVPNHYLLHRKDLPKISDWWSGLLIPLLTWYLTYRIQKRLVRENDSETGCLKFQKNICFRFLAALLYGILLSLFFHLGYTKITGYLFNGIILLGLFFPVYRAECLLGFVLGMTFTFGAVISTAAGTVFVIIGLILYLYVRRGTIFLVRKISSLITLTQTKI